MAEQAKVGLSSAEVEERKRKGLDNQIDLSTSRPLTDIIRSNFFSIANLTLLAIVIVLILVGKVSDGIVTGGVVLINIFLGAYQEYRAKLKLDQIALLTRPKVTVFREGKEQDIDQTEVVVGDAIVLNAGDQAVVDGKLIQDPRDTTPARRVDMDESLLTGESDLVPKYPGDEILSGSFCVVGKGIFIAEKVGNDSFAQKLTKGARQYTTTMTPLQQQISIIVRGLVIVAMLLSVMLGLKAVYNKENFGDTLEEFAVTISLIPQGLLLMITIAYALGALRMALKGVLVQQSNAVESLSHVDVLCLDKTGTLTTNRILFDALHPLNDINKDQLSTWVGDYIASAGKDNRTGEAVAEAIQGKAQQTVAVVPFSSSRKWAAASFENGSLKGSYVLGAPEMVMPDLHTQTTLVDDLAKRGLRVLVFAHSDSVIRPEDIPEDREPNLPDSLTPLGLISFSDELRPKVQDVLENFRKAGVALKLISGDNPVTVAALAYQAGFSQEDHAISGIELARMAPLEFREAVRQNGIFGRITPEQKQTIVQFLRDDGHYVAMMGDGVNDVLSLKQAQVGIAMEDGSQATRSVADIVLLGNKFEAMPEAFLEGQRILNGMNDVNRLFLTRAFYTILLIIIVGFIGTEFPLNVEHNALLTTLAVGAPAFFLTIWAKTGAPKKGLLVGVTEFVFPVGLTFTILTTFIWILYRTYDPDTTVETSRSVLTTAAIFGGLWIVILAEHDRESWQDGIWNTFDKRRVWLSLSMLAVFALVIVVPGLREFFDMTTLSWADLATLAVSMSAWALGLYLVWRYDVLERLTIPNYGKKESLHVKVDVDVVDKPHA